MERFVDSGTLLTFHGLTRCPGLPRRHESTLQTVFTFECIVPITRFEVRRERYGTTRRMRLLNTPSGREDEVASLTFSVRTGKAGIHCITHTTASHSKSI